MSTFYLYTILFILIMSVFYYSPNKLISYLFKNTQRIRVNCWYCNTDAILDLSLGESARYWICQRCESENFRDEVIIIIIISILFSNNHQSKDKWWTPLFPQNARNHQKVRGHIVTVQAYWWLFIVTTYRPYIPDPNKPTLCNECQKAQALILYLSEGFIPDDENVRLDVKLWPCTDIQLSIRNLIIRKDVNSICHIKDTLMIDMIYAKNVMMKLQRTLNNRPSNLDQQDYTSQTKTPFHPQNHKIRSWSKSATVIDQWPNLSYNGCFGYRCMHSLYSTFITVK